jgi:hypothetical protein
VCILVLVGCHHSSIFTETTCFARTFLASVYLVCHRFRASDGTEDKDLLLSYTSVRDPTVTLTSTSLALVSLTPALES